MDITQIGSKFRALLLGKIKNRPLVWLWGATPSFAVQNAGYPVAAAYNDPQKSFDAQIQTIAQFGEDGIPRMAVGGASVISPMYIAEASPARIRGRMVSVNQFAIVTGFLVVYFVNYFIRIPCQIVRSGGQLVYRLLNWNPWFPAFRRFANQLQC